MEHQSAENRVVELAEKVEVYMEAEESGKRLTDCAAEKLQQVCIKTVTFAMAVASIAQRETVQWISRVEAMGEYTEAEVVEVVSQTKEWFARVNQAAKKVQKNSHTKSDLISIAEMIQAMYQNIVEVVDGVQQFITTIHICQAKVEAIQADLALKEARENVDRVEAEAKAKTKKEMKEAMREAREKVAEKTEEAEEAKAVVRRVVKAAQRGEFSLKTAAKETKEAMIEAHRRWRIVMEQLHETWNKVIKAAVDVSVMLQTETHAWILKAEKVMKHVDEPIVEMAMQTEVQLKEDFSQMSQWVEEIKKESLQMKSLMESNFTAIAKITKTVKTVIQDTVKVIAKAEKIMAQVDGFQTKVEIIQATIAAEKAETEARETEAEAIVAKIEYKVAVNIKKKEEAEVKATEKRKVARIVREEAKKKATAVKEAKAKAKLVEAGIEAEEEARPVEAGTTEAEEKARLVKAEAKTQVTQAIMAMAYVTNGNSNTVSVIDIASNIVIAVIKVGYCPIEIAVTSDGTRAYVTNYISNTVSIIDTASQTVIATITGMGNGPSGIVLTPDDIRAYVTNCESYSISVIDIVSQAVIATIPTAEAEKERPGRVAITPNGTEIYVTNATNRTVSVIDTTSHAVIATIKVGENPYGVAITPNGTEVYVTNSESHTVSVIHTASRAVIATIHVGGRPYGVAITPNGTKVYVANEHSGTVSVIDTTRHTVIVTISVGINPCEVAVTPDGTQVYVTDKSNDIVCMINTATHQVQETTIPVGRGPHCLTVGEMRKAPTP
jgi:YVTN family beta-propeller protein